MQDTNALIQNVNNLYNSINQPNTDTRATLILATILLDIREQNMLIIQLLQKR